MVFNEAWGQFDTVEVTPVLLLCCAALVQYAPGDQGGDGGGREQAGDRGQRLDRLPGTALRCAVQCAVPAGQVGHLADGHVYPGPSNGGTRYSPLMFSTELYHRFAPADPARAAVLGELWGQVIICRAL